MRPRFAAIAAYSGKRRSSAVGSATAVAPLPLPPRVGCGVRSCRGRSEGGQCRRRAERFLQQIAIGGEVLGNADAVVEAIVDDRHVAIGAGEAIDEAERLLPDDRLVRLRRGGGIEEHDDVVPGGTLGRYAGTFEREARELLLLAVFPDAEVLLREESVANLPFLSMATASTRTVRVSARMMGPAGFLCVETGCGDEPGGPRTHAAEAAFTALTQILGRGCAERKPGGRGKALPNFGRLQRLSDIFVKGYLPDCSVQTWSQPSESPHHHAHHVTARYARREVAFHRDAGGGQAFIEASHRAGAFPLLF